MEAYAREHDLSKQKSSGSIRVLAVYNPYINYNIQEVYNMAQNTAIKWI